MSTYVQTLNQTQIQALKARLFGQEVPNNNPYVDLAAKVKGVTVLIYTSKKVVFQGNDAQTVASQLGLTTELSSPQSYDQNLPMIGTDEVGNGSYFGGIAVVASFVRPEDHTFLRSLGVDDSKHLNDSKIRQLAPILKEKISHKALLLSPQTYNQQVGKELPHNAVSVKVALHNQAIFLLLESGVKPEKIVIDAFTSKKNYDKYLKNEKNHFPNPVNLEEKAEGHYLAVAVSSIIARDLFLENLEKLSADCGYRLPSGAGTKSDKVASQILAAYGMQGLAHLAKLHFANTKKAQKLLKH